MKYLVAVASDISKEKGDSQLWYINGTWVNIVNPVEVKTLSDGRVMVAWSIDENKGYELTGETIFGMTSTSSTGRSVISYVGFTSDLKKTERELNDAVGIRTPSIDHDGAKKVYSLDGASRPALSHGMNIVVDNDGKASKVYFSH